MDNSTSSRYRETRPKKAVLLMMFLSIQVEIEPHKIRITEGWFCKTRSHQTFNFEVNVGSFEPIHEISSKRITVGFFVRFLERCVKASLQSVKVKGGR